MEYRRLGHSGLKVSEFSFGSWATFGTSVDTKLATDCMALAYERGVNFFDNAEIYAGGESERVMGEALKKLGWGRDTYTVSSKVFWGGQKPTQLGLSRKHVFDACHAALKRLQLDYLDLYFCHRPDPETPIAETVIAMNDLMRQGKVMYWGTSEWSDEQIFEAQKVADDYRLVGPSMEQPEYNLFKRERVEGEYAHVFQKLGIGTTIWSPLASGLLTGKYENGIPGGTRVNQSGYEWLKARFESAEGKEKIAQAKALRILAEENGLTLTHLSLLWCLKNPNVSTVILGASKLEQLRDNLNALDHKAKLTPELMQKIQKIVGSIQPPA
ncbi:MAG: aldo/keto reductase [Bdellovibrionota bacterium]